MISPFTGQNSPGYRFKFLARQISHNPLFLPLEMKELPQIQLLLKGESPLSVFKVSSISDAHKEFHKLRYAYDFPFWAANEYHIRHVNDPDLIVPLILNQYQHQIIDTFLKQYYNKEIGRYVITKNFPNAGVSTCVQAYMLWSQIYRWHNHSYTCAYSDLLERQLKSNLIRFLKRDVTPSDMRIPLPMVGNSAFFNTFRSPDAIRGINFAYVHFADFSKFFDPDTKNSSRAFVAGFSPVLLDYHTLIVLEGNIPNENRFRLQDYFKNSEKGKQISSYESLTPYCRNPYFLLEAIAAADPASSSLFRHLPLSKLWEGGFPTS